jgi:GNAT superfamily N-acetyltransferase
MVLSLPRGEHARPRPDAFVVRALTSADAEDAAHVIRGAFAFQSRATNPPSSAFSETADSVAAKIARGVGAFVEGRLVAAAVWQFDGDALLIGRVCALPEARGRALSRRLIAVCESAARARRIGRLRLRVRLELPENERLFRRMGFVRVRVDAHPGFDAPTIAVMEKRVS